jgi:hypothetical protein
MKLFRSLSFILATLLVCSNSNAVNCGGKIERVYVTKSSDVNIWADWRGDYTRLCNLEVSWGGVPPETCKAWFSMALAIKISGSNATAQYAGNDNCTAIPTYSDSPAPNYFMSQK